MELRFELQLRTVWKRPYSCIDEPIRWLERLLFKLVGIWNDLSSTLVALARTHGKLSEILMQPEFWSNPFQSQHNVYDRWVGGSPLVASLLCGSPWSRAQLDQPLMVCKKVRFCMSSLKRTWFLIRAGPVTLCSACWERFLITLLCCGRWWWWWWLLSSP